jgi:hypothetical protein
MLQSNRGLESLSLKKHNFTCDGLYVITEHLLGNLNYIRDNKPI